MIKKIKLDEGGIWIDPEKEITAKKDGKKYTLTEVNLHIADDSKEYAGKYVRVAFFDYVDAKDAKKNKSGKDKAEYFKTQNDGKEILLDITEDKYTNKEGKEGVSLKGKILTKAQREVAEQFVK